MNKNITHSSNLTNTGLYLIAIFDIFGIAYGVSLAADLVRPASSSSKEQPLLPEGEEEMKQEDSEVDEEQSKDELPGLTTVFVTCALATVVSSCLGCTPVIALGESFVRIFFCSKIHTLSINSKLRTGWCSRGRSNRFDCCFVRSVYDSCASVLTDRCKYTGLCNVSCSCDFRCEPDVTHKTLRL